MFIDNCKPGYLMGEVDDTGKVIIPAVVDGHTVTRIGPHAFKGNMNITEIVIPATVEKIKPYAFANCSNLKSVIFENDSNLKAIERNAFYNCGIEEIYIPAKAWYIGLNAFTGSKLRSITGGYSVDTIYKECFSNCKDLKELNFNIFAPYCMTILAGAFENSGLQKLFWPSNIAPLDDDKKGISPGAFYGCKLQEVIVDKNTSWMSRDSVIDFFKSNDIEVQAILSAN